MHRASLNRVVGLSIELLQTLLKGNRVTLFLSWRLRRAIANRSSKKANVLSWIHVHPQLTGKLSESKESGFDFDWHILHSELRKFARTPLTKESMEQVCVAS